MATNPAVEPAPLPPSAPAPVVVTLSRQSSRQIKHLVRGHGRLLDRIIDTVDQLKEQGRVAKDAQPIVVVVKESEAKDFKLFG
jgi:hypothetical protein